MRNSNVQPPLLHLVLAMPPMMLMFVRQDYGIVVNHRVQLVHIQLHRSVHSVVDLDGMQPQPAMEMCETTADDVTYFDRKLAGSLLKLLYGMHQMPYSSLVVILAVHVAHLLVTMLTSKMFLISLPRSMFECQRPISLEQFFLNVMFLKVKNYYLDDNLPEIYLYSLVIRSFAMAVAVNQLLIQVTQNMIEQQANEIVTVTSFVIVILYMNPCNSMPLLNVV